MVARTVVLASVVSLTALAFESAPAQDQSAVGFPQYAAASGVRFNEADDRAPVLDIRLRDNAPLRFGASAQSRAEPGLREDGVGYEFSATAPRERTGLLVDLALAQRTNIAVDENGDIGRAGAGVEVRVGRNLERLARPWTAPQQGAWYIFAASDGQALTWTPDNNLGAPRGVHLQDRVTIGDAQVGVTYEQGPFQTSFAITQREVTYHRLTSEGYSEDESFAGLMLSWRR